MTQFSERHIRLIKKEQELEKLFEEAANRRKKLLEKKNEETFNFKNEIGLQNQYILKPLRSTDNLSTTDTNDNKVGLSLQQMCRQLQRRSSYSQHDLPETNLDYEEISLTRSNNNYHRQNTANSSENLNESCHRNTNIVTYSSSSDEVDKVSNYCQFIPTTSLSTDNNTSSSHYSRTDTSTGKLSSLGPSSSEAGSHLTRDIDDNTHSVRYVEDNTHKIRDLEDNVPSDADTQRQATVLCYPSGSPLISHKYQGSPVVRIDDKLRAGEAEYLVNRRRPSLLKKLPLLSHNQKLPQTHMKCLASPETRLSHPVLIDINETDTQPSSPLSVDNPNHNSTWIIRRTKKKLLEDHMRKRFSVGDYSTRALIEWQNNLNFAAIEHFSNSGDLPAERDGKRKPLKRTLSSQSDAIFPICNKNDMLTTSLNFSSEVNIVHYSSTDSFRDTQVSFSLKNEGKQNDEKSQSRYSDKFFKRTNFLRRSMNDVVAALKHVTSSDKAPIPKRFLFSHRHGIFKKRESTSSDLLDSVPLFARKRMPADISGAARLMSQGTYQGTNLPSSTPNLIAELDPTFHERYPLESPPMAGHNNITKHPLCKRNRSYRLSFIENAHTVTTKKLTASNITSPPSSATILRFVQPRRRMASHNSSKARRQELPHMEPRDPRSRSSNRFSCAQQ